LPFFAPSLLPRPNQSNPDSIAVLKAGVLTILLKRTLIISHTFVMGLGSPFKGPHKPIHGRLAAAFRAADALFMGSPTPWFAIV